MMEENCHLGLDGPTAQQEQLTTVSYSTVPDSYPDYAVVSKAHAGPLCVQMSLDGKPISMQVDNGAAATLISQATRSSLWDSPPPLTKSNTSLMTYTGEDSGVI